MPIGPLGMMLGQMAGSSLFGIGLARYNDARQLGQQAKLQQLQLKGQKEMADYNYQNQMKMWEATNYAAQMEQLKKAGLNPGLLYGMSGGGGTTMGQQSGQISGGEAPRGGGEIQSLMGMGLQSIAQLALTKSQIAANEGAANNQNAQADATRGVKTDEGLQNIKESQWRIEVDKFRIEDIRQGIMNQEAERQGMLIDNESKIIQRNLSAATYEEDIKKIQLHNQKSEQELELLKRENKLSEEQYKDKVRQLKLQNALLAIQATAIKEGIKLTQEQVNIAKQEIKRLIFDNENNANRMSNENQKLEILRQLMNFETDPVNNALKQIFGVGSGIIGGLILGGVQPGRTVIQGFKKP